MNGRINRPDTRKHLNRSRQKSRKTSCLNAGVHTRTLALDPQADIAKVRDGWEAVIAVSRPVVVLWSGVELSENVANVGAETCEVLLQELAVAIDPAMNNGVHRIVNSGLCDLDAALHTLFSSFRGVVESVLKNGNRERARIAGLFLRHPLCREHSEQKRANQGLLERASSIKIHIRALQELTGHSVRFVPLLREPHTRPGFTFPKHRRAPSSRPNERLL